MLKYLLVFLLCYSCSESEDGKSVDPNDRNVSEDLFQEEDFPEESQGSQKENPIILGEEPTVGCGVELLTAGDSVDQEVTTEDTVSHGKTDRGISYSVKFRSRLELSYSWGSFSANNLTNLKNVSPPNGRGRVRDRIESFSGRRTFHFETSDPSNFVSREDDSKYGCGFRVSRLLEERGKYETDFQISPPVPTFFNLTMPRERAIREFSRNRVFSYKSKVVQTNHPEYSEGEIIEGEISFKLVDSIFRSASGTETADFAIRVATRNFTKEEKNTSSQIYYVKNNRIVAIKWVTGREEVPELEYFK